MSETGALRIGDIVRKRASKAPFPPLFRIVEIISDGREALIRPASGGSLAQVPARSVTKTEESKR
jgi:hypothetical protein